MTKVEEEQERIYTIPLREAYNQPWTKRARKAVRIVKEFLQRHTKQEIKIGNDVNEEIWKRGMKHPPRKIRVIVKGGVANLVK
ncbi:MAG: 50S ribosomal protein L31e [Candidatus Altarchaeaceae archaeon]